MIDTDTVVQLGGWILAAFVGVYETWRAFTPKKKGKILSEVKNAISDGRIEPGEVIDVAKEWIAEDEKTDV